MLRPEIVLAALLTLAPLFLFGFLEEAVARGVRSLPLCAQLAAPALLCAPYVLVAAGTGVFRWTWLAVYALLPAALAVLLRLGRRHGNGWIELLALAALGLSVDLRWLERAWPAHLAIFNKMLLLDASLYAFLVVRQLDGVGFDLRLRLRDAIIGLRELAAYTPLALALGLSLGFLHLHGGWPGMARIVVGWLFTFFFIAVPEEVFFRGWLQNLLERRLGARGALLVTALLFGLAHFNKRAVHFNWRYVLLAALAGVFYGRAWRQQRRVAASAITHASVDTIWSLWLR